MLMVRKYDGVESLPPAYSDVFEDAGQVSIFVSRPWFEVFERGILGAGRHATIYGVEDESAAARPLAALVLEGREGRGLLVPRQLVSLGNYYTCFYGVARRRESMIDGQEVYRALGAALWSDRTSWDVIELEPLVKESAEFSWLVECLTARGASVQTYFCFGNWYSEVRGTSYREYLGSLPAVLRKNIPYNIRRLERTVDSRVEIITNQAGVERALDDYERVYLASWKRPEPYPEFIRALVRRAADLGWLRLGVAHVAGEPAAAQVWFVHSGVASIYKIAYDERFAKLSVGTALTARMMEHVIDVDRVNVVDYLSGDDDYKSRWMSSRREFWGILAFNPRSLRGVVQMARHVGGGAVRARLRGLAAWKRAVRSGWGH